MAGGRFRWIVEIWLDPDSRIGYPSIPSRENVKCVSNHHHFTLLLFDTKVNNTFYKSSVPLDTLEQIATESNYENYLIKSEKTWNFIKFNQLHYKMLSLLQILTQSLVKEQFQRTYRRKSCFCPTHFCQLQTVTETI